MSMISTSNYVARKFGVRSAMPGFIAKRLCPDLVFVPCDFAKYEAASKQAQEVVRRYEHGYKHDSGLDEFYIDITDSVSRRHAELHGCASRSIFDLRKTAELVVAEMRAAITESTGGLTCSAGIANNFFLAKICADRNKPNGQFSLPPSREDIIEFVRQLPCRKVGGIGKVFEKLLNDLGMSTIGDVAQNLAPLYHVLTPSMLHFLTRTCMGVGREEDLGEASGRRGWGGDSAGEATPVLQKSVGTERTFRATEDRKELYIKLYDISLSVISRTKEKGLHPRQLTLKVKAADFDLLTRSMNRPLNAPNPFFTEVDDVFAAAKELLDGFQPLIKIRLLGVSLSHFKEETEFSDSSRTSKAGGQLDIASFFSKTRPKGSEELPRPQNSSSNDLASKATVQESNECSDHKEYTTTADPLSSYNCPVCNEDLWLPSLGALNDHIDECLSFAALKEEGERYTSSGDAICSAKAEWLNSAPTIGSAPKKRTKLNDYMIK
jgi:DNA polymerase kappa